GWPAQTYAVRGDPRFGLVGVFPSESARVSAEAGLDPTRLDCGLDPRVARPTVGSFFVLDNVLVQVFAGHELTDRLAAAFGPGGDLRSVPFPDASPDESLPEV